MQKLAPKMSLQEQGLHPSAVVYFSLEKGTSISFIFLFFAGTMEVGAPILKDDCYEQAKQSGDQEKIQLAHDEYQNQSKKLNILYAVVATRSPE